MALGKITIHLKNADSIADAINRKVGYLIESKQETNCFKNNEEFKEVEKDLQEEIVDRLKKYVEFKEYISVEIDLDTLEANVIPSI